MQLNDNFGLQTEMLKDYRSKTGDFLVFTTNFKGI